MTTKWKASQNLLVVLAVTALNFTMYSAKEMYEPGTQWGWSFATGGLAWLTVVLIVAAARADR